MFKIIAYVIGFFIITALFLNTSSQKSDIKNQSSDEKLLIVWDKDLSYTPNSADYAKIISAPLYALEYENETAYMKELSNTEEYLSRVDKPVWGMYTNGFNPDNTRVFITDDKSRSAIVDSIISTAVSHKLSGINIDFENMYSEDAQYFTMFIKELSEKAGQYGLKTSVDVTKINKGSRFYSMCYNRRELAKYADYIILMAYDQFPRTSTVAGPVSSIPWTTDAIEGILAEVPSDKLILGVPFYTRLWTENDGVVTSCPAISMTESAELIAEHSPKIYSDTDTGLSYFQFENASGINKVWQENKDSIQKRCDIADQFDLKGIACWSLGFEAPEAEDVLKRWINSK